MSTTMIKFADGGLTSVAGGGGNFIVSSTTSVSTSSAGTIKFATSDSQRMVIDSGGNVGIGTMNPNATLEVNGTVSATSIRFSDGTTQTTAARKVGGNSFSFASGNCTTPAAACSIDISSIGFTSNPACTIIMVALDATGYVENMVIQNITTSALKVWKGNYQNEGTTMTGYWMCVGS